MDGLDEIPETLLDEWLTSDAFAQRMVRFHTARLWNVLDNPNLATPSRNLASERRPPVCQPGRCPATPGRHSTAVRRCAGDDR